MNNKICVLVKIDPKHSTFRIYYSYFSALKNIFKYDEVYDYRNIQSLEKATHFVIIDECYEPHKQIWMNQTIIDYINQRNMPVLILNLERIYNSLFELSLFVQGMLNRYRNKIQFVVDVQDCMKLNQKMCLKTKFSQELYNIYNVSPKEKINKILFKGSIYLQRQKIIDFINKNIMEVVINNTNSGDFNAYIQTISEYKYILCPMGTGVFFNPRFYESLVVNSIPIQYSTDMMKEYYNEEITQSNAIFFHDKPSLTANIINFQQKPCENKFYLEDTLIPLFKSKNIL